jgi:branched-chain amino acid transport system substrate-binding protein
MRHDLQRWTRRSVIGGLAGGLSLSLARQLAAAPTGDPVRIGSTLALTGPLAQTAMISKIVGDIYVDEWNKRGGIMGRPVEWLLYDDQSRPEMVRSLYEKLLTVDKVDLIMGPYGTAGILAAMGVAQRFQKLFIQSSLGIPKLATYEMQIPATAFGSEPDKAFPKLVFDAVATAPHPPKSIAILTSKFPSAQVWTQGAKAEAVARGLEVPLYLEYEFGTRDFGAIAARVKDANPDFLWLGALGTDGNQLMESFKKLDYAPPLQFILFPAPGPLVVAPEANHALAFSTFEEHPPYTDRPGAAHFIELYHDRAAKAGLPYTHVDNQAVGPYCGWQILDASVTGSKSLDDKAMLAYIKQNGVDTLAGKLTFNGPFNSGESEMAVKQIQDGKYVVVWPQKDAAPGTALIAP